MRELKLENELVDMFRKKIAVLVKRFNDRTATAKYYKKHAENNGKACIVAQNVAQHLSKENGAKDAETASLKDKINDAYKKASVDAEVSTGFLDGCTLDARIDIMLLDLEMFRMGKVDSAAEIERLKGKLSYISVECNKLPYFDEYPNETDKVDAILTALIHYKNLSKTLNKEKARARKSESEKRKLMGLITKHVKPNREGTLDPKKLIAGYKAWLEERRSK